MGYFDDLWPNTQAPSMYTALGGSVYSNGKLVTGVVGTAYNRLLLPSDLMQVSGQGATPEQILINAWGACGTATGETMTVATPFLGSQTNDGYGLAIPTAPQPHDSIRVRRDSLTGSRVITHKITKQKRQGFLQDIRPLDGIIIKHYGTYSFVDANGVTHQPPGKRDPVVQLPGVGANIDKDTIKFDENGRMYADFFGTGGVNGSAGTSVNGLNAGHGIEIIPGFSPTDSPELTIEAGGSVPAGTYQWADCYVIDGKRTPLSPSIGGTTVDATTGPPPTPAYHQPHLLIPGKPDIIHATALELYRKDAGVGANGTVQTKFAYTSSPGVLITDGSTGATKIASGAYTGMYQYTVTSTHSGVDTGDGFEYNPVVRVQVGDPPIPYDPRDGSLTTLVENGANDGSSIFKTSDGGAFNQLTGAITYPLDNPKNHSGFRLVDSLTPSHDPQDYIDTKADADLGILFQRDPTVINIKPARYTGQPFSGMASIPGTVPPLYELSGIGFNSADPLFGNDGAYVRTHEGLVLDAQNNVVPFLAASATLPAVGAGKRTTMSIPGYSDPMYDLSSLDLYAGDDALGMQVRIDGSSITRRASDGALQTVAGSGSANTSARVQIDDAINFMSGTLNGGAASVILVWDISVWDSGGYAALTDTRLTAQIDGVHRVSCAVNCNAAGTSATTTQMFVNIFKNGSLEEAGDIVTIPKNVNAVAAGIPQCSTLLDLVAGDYVESQLVLDQTSIYYGNDATTHFTIEYVGPSV